MVIFGPRLKFCAARYVWIRTQIIHEESGNSRNCYSSIQSHFIMEDAFPTFVHGMNLKIKASEQYFSVVLFCYTKWFLPLSL